MTAHAHHEHEHHEHHEHGSDMKAAFTGLIVGALALVLILGGIVYLTAQRYAHEHPAAESSK